MSELLNIKKIDQFYNPKLVYIMGKDGKPFLVKTDLKKNVNTQRNALFYN